MNNTTATPRERIAAAILGSVSTADARRAVGNLEIEERDASVRVKLSRINADVCRELDKMSHPRFVEARDALAQPSAEALAAFGLGDPSAWGMYPRRVWDPYAGTGRPREHSSGSAVDDPILSREIPPTPPQVKPARERTHPRRASDRHSKADEALSDLIAEKILARMPRPGVPHLTVNVAPLAEAEVERAVAAALAKAARERTPADDWDARVERGDHLIELNKWKARAGANEARAERLGRIVGAWSAASQTTRENVGVWDRDLGNALGDARDAAVLGITEAEIHADADRAHAPTPEVIEDRRRLNERAEAPSWPGADAFPGSVPATAAERREAAAETPKDGPLGRKVREALQREQGVTFKREDLDALHRLLAQFSAPGRDAQRIALLNTWPTLSHALDGLLDAYKRATA